MKTKEKIGVSAKPTPNATKLQNKDYQETVRDSSGIDIEEFIQFRKNNIRTKNRATFDNSNIGDRLLRINKVIPTITGMVVVISKINSFITVDDGLSPQRLTREEFFDEVYFHFEKLGGVK